MPLKGIVNQGGGIKMSNSVLMRRIIKFSILTLLMGVLFVISEAVAEEDLVGASEYRTSCLSCHGVGGKGNGPMAKLPQPQ